jgi:hypothetical protein
LEKAIILVQAGVKTVWTIEPYSRTIFVTDKDEEKVVHNSVVESEGITVDFQKIFDSDISLSA